jgi:hypothetical protein
MATIGRNKAVADLKIIRFGGFPAWLSWLFVHLLFLVGLPNQMQVFFQWAWAYFTYARGAGRSMAAFTGFNEVNRGKRANGTEVGRGRTTTCAPTSSALLHSKNFQRSVS